MAIDVRKGMPSVQLNRQEFEIRFLAKFYDPLFEPLKPELDKIMQTAWTVYDKYHKAPRTRKAGPGFADPDLRALGRWLATRDADRRGTAPARRSGRPAADSARSTARRERAHLSGRDVEDLAPGRARASDVDRSELGFAVDVLDLSPPDLGIRQVDSSLQVVRLDRHAALPLAVQLLSELCARPGQRLDERDLSALGRSARGDDRDAGELVPGAGGAQVDDGSPRLRRRRQSRSDIDARQERRRGEGARAAGLALSAPSRRPRFRSLCMATRSARRMLRRILSDWLLDMDLIPSGHLEPRSTAMSAISSLMPPVISELDKDEGLQEDVRNAARALVQAVKDRRSGKLEPPDRGLHEAKPK